MFGAGKSIRIYSVIIVAILAAVLALVLFGFNRASRTEERVVVRFDETVIIDRFQELSTLQTASVIVQRDIEVELDLGTFEFQGIPLLDSKKSQKLAATGRVIAGVDLSKIEPEMVTLEEGNLMISLPEPEILAIELDESKTTLLREDWTLLFSVESFIGGRRQELNEKLRDQVAEQTRASLLDGACEADILGKANEGAQESITNLFLFADLESIEVNTSVSAECDLF